MRPTIRNLQNEILSLKAKCNGLAADKEDLEYKLRRERAEVERLKACSKEDRIVREKLEAVVRTMKREAELNKEILRLTQELNASRKQDTGPSGDKIFMTNGTSVSRRVVADAIRAPGSSFILAIKSIREQTDCGLHEAKLFCEQHFPHLKPGVASVDLLEGNRG